MPITLVCTGCGKSYQLKDELAGRKVRCPGCQSVQVVPADSLEEYSVEAEAGDDAPRQVLHSAFNHDKFLLRQKLMTIGSKYLVWDEQQRPILFIERPAHFWRGLLAALAAALFFIVGVIASFVIGLGIGQVLNQEAGRRVYSPSCS